MLRANGITYLQGGTHLQNPFMLSLSKQSRFPDYQLRTGARSSLR
jgi:hypothetical protein